MNNHRRLRNRIINEEGLYPGQEPTDEDYADYRRMERTAMITLALERLRLDTGEIETTTPMEFSSHAHATWTINALNRNAHVYNVVYLLSAADAEKMIAAESQ